MFNSIMTGNRPIGDNRTHRVIPIVLMAVILFFSAWVRFDGITEQGITGYDSFDYLLEAKQWADGRPATFMENRCYRPVVHYLQGIAVKVLGYNDYSIKVLHGILDMLSILLIFSIASRLVGNPWGGVLAGLFYAFLPKVVYFARYEMVHAQSTVFVLLALYLFILYDRRTENGIITYLLLILSGVSTGLAANTHLDLAFLAPGFVLYIALKRYKQQKGKPFIKQLVLQVFIYGAAFALPYMVGFIAFGIDTFIQVNFKNMIDIGDRAVKKYGAQPRYLIVFHIIYYSLKFFFGKTATLVGILFTGSLAVIGYRKWKKIKDPMESYLPLFLLATYVTGLTLSLKMFPRGWGRLFMALLPMVLIIIIQWYDKILIQVFKKYARAILIVAFAILFLFIPKMMPWDSIDKSQYRYVYDVLEDEVDSDSKVLIAPAIIATALLPKTGFNSGVYFGNNAVYLRTLPINPKYNLESLTKELLYRNIRYIFVGKRLNRRLLNPKLYRKHRGFLNDNADYTLKKDLEILMEYIKSEDGSLVESSKYGKIYRLPPQDNIQKTGVIENGSFEQWQENIPMGKWTLRTGRVSKTTDATHGQNALCLQPGGENGTILTWDVENPSRLAKDGAKLRVNLDARAGEKHQLVFFIQVINDGKRSHMAPGLLKYQGGGQWETLSEFYSIPAELQKMAFILWLRPGAEKPAYVDNLSIELIEKKNTGNPGVRIGGENAE